VAAIAHNADRPAVALGLADRPHVAARRDAERRLLAVGRFFALLREFLGSHGEVQVLAASEEKVVMLMSLEKCSSSIFDPAVVQEFKINVIDCDLA
jgi:hypothetical protein